MILDSLLLLDDDLTTTTNVASSSVIDTVAAGDSYEGAWFFVQVSTSFTATGAPKTSFQVQTSATEAFTVVATLVASSEYLVAELPAGTFIKMRIPPGAKRYIRGYKYISNYTSSTIVLTACAYSMYICKDVSIPVESPNVLA